MMVAVAAVVVVLLLLLLLRPAISKFCCRFWLWFWFVVSSAADAAPGAPTESTELVVVETFGCATTLKDCWFS